MNGLLDRIAAPYRRDARRDARASLPAYQRNVMLSQPQSYQSLLGVPTVPAPIAPVVGAQQFAQPQVLSTPAPQAQPQRGLLDEIERQPTPAPSLLGRIGGGIRSAAQEVGGLFEGDEGRARAAALSRSLLRGPSLTPISFGQSLAEGLSAGGEEIKRQALRKEKMEALERSSKMQKRKDEAIEVIYNKDATPEEVTKALRMIDPIAYAKAESKNKSLSQVKADFLTNLKKDNPEEFKRLVTKSIEGGSNQLGGIFGPDALATRAGAPKPTDKTLRQQAAEEIARRAALEGQ